MELTGAQGFNRIDKKYKIDKNYEGQCWAKKCLIKQKWDNAVSFGYSEKYRSSVTAVRFTYNVLIMFYHCDLLSIYYQSFDTFILAFRKFLIRNAWGMNFVFEGKIGPSNFSCFLYWTT